MVTFALARVLMRVCGMQLTQLLAALSTRESRVQHTAAAAAASFASAALMASQLRVAWLDAQVQHAFCVHHFADYGAGQGCAGGGICTCMVGSMVR